MGSRATYCLIGVLVLSGCASVDSLPPCTPNVLAQAGKCNPNLRSWRDDGTPATSKPGDGTPSEERKTWGAPTKSMLTSKDVSQEWLTLAHPSQCYVCKDLAPEERQAAANKVGLIVLDVKERPTIDNGVVFSCSEVRDCDAPVEPPKPEAR